MLGIKQVDKFLKLNLHKELLKFNLIILLQKLNLVEIKIY